MYEYLRWLQDEQRAIFEENSREKKALTWGQTRNMPLTHRVIISIIFCFYTYLYIINVI